MTKKSAWNKAGKRQNKNGEVEKMARKDDILSIYTREVEGIKEAGLFKGEAPFVSPQGARVKMEDGRELLCMCANNYLGLGDNPRLIEAAKRTYDEKGYGVASVRFICGTQDIHKKLEKKISGFLGTDDTILYSSCFDANGGLFETILTAEDAVISDELNHASIVDGCRISKAETAVYRHSDMADLEKQLQRVPEQNGALIVTDGVFSMGGDIAKLPEICALAKKYGARVMVDDAHGLGVLGEGGRGTASYFGLEDQVDVYMGTFSKSLASLGGYMAASEEVADYVRHVSRPFIFSASIPPANCATALAALRHLEAHPELPERLRALSLYARRGMTDRGLKIRESALTAPTPIIPIYTYETYHTLEVARDIYDRGVYVNPTLPPATPEGEALLRTSYMATHTEALLDEAMDIMADVLVKDHE